MGHGPHSSKIFVLFYTYVLFVLCRSVYCLCVNVYCTTLLPLGGYPITVNKYIISNCLPFFITTNGKGPVVYVEVTLKMGMGERGQEEKKHKAIENQSYRR